MKNNYFFIDAETDGLYGSFLSVGILVTDSSFTEMNRAYYGIKKENLHVTDAWVEKYVIPVMGEYEPCEDENELLEKVWGKWMQYGDDAYAVGDVIYPVESRLFMKCVEHHPEERKLKGPFPLLDVSSIMYAKGENPLADREIIYEQSNASLHNAMSDAEGMAALMKRLMEKRK